MYCQRVNVIFHFFKLENITEIFKFFHTRNGWLDKEVKLLLEIFQTQNINQYFDTKKYKNGEIYQLVYEELVKKGVTTKNVLQIKNKWKVEKVVQSVTILPCLMKY